MDQQINIDSLISNASITINDVFKIIKLLAIENENLKKELEKKKENE